MSNSILRYVVLQPNIYSCCTCSLLSGLLSVMLSCLRVKISDVNCSVIVSINTDFRILFFFVNSSNFLLNQLIWRKGLKAWLTENIWRGTRAILKYTITWHSIFTSLYISKFLFLFLFFFKWHGRGLMFIPSHICTVKRIPPPPPPLFFI